MKIAMPKKVVLSKVGPTLPREHFEVLYDSNEGHVIPFPDTLRWNPHGATKSAILTIGRRCVNLGRLSKARGDITLEGYTHVVGIERKGKVSELVWNVKTGKLHDQLSTMKRWVKHCYLLLDIPLPELYGTGKNAGFHPEDSVSCVLDRVIHIANSLSVPIIGPVTAKGKRTRTVLGEYLLRIMLSHIHGAAYVPYAAIQRELRG